MRAAHHLRRTVAAAATVIAVVAAPLAGATGASAAEKPADKKAAVATQNLRLVGYSDLGGGGLNGEVAVVGTTAIVGAGMSPSGGVHIHFYNPYDPCGGVPVKVVDLSNPRHPRVTSTIPVPEDVAALDVAALRMSTPSFSGDLAAVALASCGPTGGIVNRGVQYYDVTNPAAPRFLGYYDADFDARPVGTPPCGPANPPPPAPPTVTSPRGCASSQHSVSLVQRPDGRVLSLSTEPFASASNRPGCGPTAPRPPAGPGPCTFPSGDLRIVDVTNPTRPTQVGSFPNGDQIPPGFGTNPRGFSHNGCRPFDAGHAVGKGGDGTQVVLPYMDLGMFNVNLADPAAPSGSAQLNLYDRNDRAAEGNAAYGASAEVSGRRLALVAEEDWVAPQSRLRVDAPAAVAGSKFACEAMFTLFDPENSAQVYRKPGSQVPGEIVYVGRGCPQVPGAHGEPPQPEPYLADPRGKIALIDRGFCGFTDKLIRAQESGALGVVFAQTSTLEAFSADGNPAGLEIPAYMIDKADADALRTALCPSRDASGNCTGGSPVTGAMVDTRGEWGGLQVVDNTNPATPVRLATYRSPRAGVFPPPDLGVYSVDQAVASGNQAYVAANSDGLRVLDLTNPALPREVASFLPDDHPDPTGQIPAKALVTGVALSGDNIVVTDVNSGLYVLRSSPFGAGYWTVAADGGIFAFGDAPFLGSMGGRRLNSPIVGMASTPSGRGYWMVAGDGGVFAFGDARFFGSMGGRPLNRPIVGMAATPSGNGYWLVASDGGVFAFGDAAFLGSMGGRPLNSPILSIAATRSGRGYWMAAADGGVFAFGDARFLGSMGGRPLRGLVVDMAPTPTGNGYWLVGADGGIFAFGDARFFGSMGGRPLNAFIVGMSATTSGMGYWMVGSDGGIFAFGDAIFLGSTGALRLNRPMVGMAAL